MDINPDIRAVIEPELMPGERLLWAQPRNINLGKMVLLSRVLGYGALSLFVLACAFGGYSAYSEGNLLVFFLCAGCLLAILWLIFFNIPDADPEAFIGVVYGITDKRILAANKRGDFQSIVGRPFFSFFKETAGDFHRISLIGPGLDEDIFEFHFENIEFPDEAQKLILENFMQVKDNPHE